MSVTSDKKLLTLRDVLVELEAIITIERAGEDAYPRVEALAQIIEKQLGDFESTFTKNKLPSDGKMPGTK